MLKSNDIFLHFRLCKLSDTFDMRLVTTGREMQELELGARTHGTAHAFPQRPMPLATKKHEPHSLPTGNKVHAFMATVERALSTVISKMQSCYATTDNEAGGFCALISLFFIYDIFYTEYIHFQSQFPPKPALDLSYYYRLTLYDILFHRS